jgi:predicted acetyltransferase
MELRNLRPDEFDASIKLMMYAFQVSMDAERLEKERDRFKPEQNWGVFEDGRLEARLTLLPFRMYVQGRALDMGGVAGVATWPEHRRRGHVAELLSHALRQMRESGQSVSCLYPFSFGFYRKFGWEISVEYKKYTVETAQLPPRVEIEGHIARMEADYSLLSPVYEAYAARYNGMLARSEDWWLHAVFHNLKNAAVYYRPDGRAAGYLLYDVSKREMNIQEMVCLDEQARRALWTYIANHDSMIDKAILKAPAGDALPYLLPNPKIGQEIVPFFMARIVDAADFARQYAFGTAETETHLTVRLSDQHAPWNEGLWRLSVARDGSGTLEKAAPAGDAQESDLSCSINAWSALMMGYRRPAELHSFGQLTGSPDAVRRLEAIIPPRQTYLTDFF